jgi:hypothetical protein
MGIEGEGIEEIGAYEGDEGLEGDEGVEGGR